jgi:hypothetical protein
MEIFGVGNDANRAADTGLEGADGSDDAASRGETTNFR